MSTYIYHIFAGLLLGYMCEHLYITNVHTLLTFTEMELDEENFVPDYDDFSDEENDKNIINGDVKVVTKKRRWRSFCDICKVRTRHRREHFITTHVPVQFNSARSSSCLSSAEVVVVGLQLLASIFHLISVDALFRYVLDNNWCLPSFATCQITDADIALFDAVSKLLYIQPVVFTLYPLNSPAVLAYWRILSCIFERLSHFDQLSFRHVVIYDFPSSDIDMVTDSHFHLYQLLKKSKCSSYDIVVMFLIINIT